jgi:hypothetical protein
MICCFLESFAIGLIPLSEGLILPLGGKGGFGENFFAVPAALVRGVLPAQGACRAENQKRAAFGIGRRGDTPPLKGCCTVTLGYRARTC